MTSSGWARTQEGTLTLSVKIPTGTVTLDGDLVVPAGAKGLVLFAHGSGSGRLSPRNRAVARALHEARFATLLFDLLAPEEEELEAQTRHLRFNIELLASRLEDATDWVMRRPEAAGLAVGYFGASTGAAAALVAAAGLPKSIRAVVSRGGRPDLARTALAQVRAPTLLIVGGDDLVVLNFNRDAQARLQCVSHLRIVAGAGHLFEEPGALEEVSALAREWFDTHLHPPADYPL
ncbi:MAG TPA: dienelactone hydrolase family protein [Gemmatimonadaceae bacterium]|nr:dienelactone hydrolase family protein [Gemmatimonadaceae bacterium]